MANMEPKVTSKGTELPIMNLKGKPYLQVAHRLVWFREDHPTGSIQTQFLRLENEYAIAKATISIEGKVVSEGTKKETLENFADFVEKAETGAIGRALAAAGYGTQFAPELDEGARIVDSPIEVPKKKAPVTPLIETPTGVVQTEAAILQKESEEMEKKAKDVTALRNTLRTVHNILRDDKKLSTPQFKEKYIQAMGFTKVDDMDEQALVKSLSALSKDFPELGQLN